MEGASSTLENAGRLAGLLGALVRRIMAAIIQFLKKDVVFEPHDIKAMSMALDERVQIAPSG